jgi:hypothetical protein
MKKYVFEPRSVHIKTIQAFSEKYLFLLALVRGMLKLINIKKKIIFKYIFSFTNTFWTSFALSSIFPYHHQYCKNALYPDISLSSPYFPLPLNSSKNISFFF